MMSPWKEENHRKSDLFYIGEYHSPLSLVNLFSQVLYFSVCLILWTSEDVSLGWWEEIRSSFSIQAVLEFVGLLLQMPRNCNYRYVASSLAHSTGWVCHLPAYVYLCFFKLLVNTWSLYVTLDVMFFSLPDAKLVWIPWALSLLQTNWHETV